MTQSLLTLKGKSILGLGGNSVEMNVDLNLLPLIEELALEKESLDKSFTDQDYQAYQLLALIQPRCWEKQLGLNAEKLIKAIVNSKHLRKYHPALVQGIVFYQNQEWADHWLQSTAKDDRQKPDAVVTLMQVASEQQLLILFGNTSIQAVLDYNHLLHLLESLDFEWSLDLSRAIMNQLYRVFAQRGVYHFETERILRLATRFHPEILMFQAEFIPSENERRDTWRTMIGDLTRIITLKSTLKKSFDE